MIDYVFLGYATSGYLIQIHINIYIYKQIYVYVYLYVYIHIITLSCLNFNPDMFPDIMMRTRSQK